MIDKDKINEIINNGLINTYSIILKEDVKEEDFINIFWDIIEDIYKYMITYIRKKIPMTKDIHLPIKKLLYDNKDEERIKKYFNSFKNSQKTIQDRNHFLNMLSRIYISEAGFIRDRSFLLIAKNLLNNKKLNFAIIKKYEIWIEFEESECGEIMGGTEIEEIFGPFWKKIEESDIIDWAENKYDSFCGHPGCLGHILDIELREVELEAEINYG